MPLGRAARAGATGAKKSWRASVVPSGALLRRARPSGPAPGGPEVVEERMTLKLVSSGDDRALAIRDHLLPLVRGHGTLELQRGPVRLAVLRTGP